MSTHNEDEEKTDKDHESGDDVIDPYLWDRSGERDAEVARLEKLLAPLAHDKPLIALPAEPAVPIAIERRRNARSILATTIVAGLALAAGIALVIKAQHDSIAVTPSPTPSAKIAKVDTPP